MRDSSTSAEEMSQQSRSGVIQAPYTAQQLQRYMGGISLSDPVLSFNADSSRKRSAPPVNLILVNDGVKGILAGKL